MNIRTFAVLNNSESNDGAGVLLGIFFIFIGALLCYAGSKLKGRNGDIPQPLGANQTMTQVANPDRGGKRIPNMMVHS